MGKEPKGLKRVKIQRIVVNHSLIDEVYIDLDHVNFGVNKRTFELNKKKRSEFTKEGVVEFVKKLDRNIYEVAREDEEYRYYETLLPTLETKKEFRLVFCVEKKRPNIICVITLYCIGKIND